MASISDRPRQPSARGELRRGRRGRSPSARRLRQRLRDDRRRLACEARASRGRIADDHRRTSYLGAQYRRLAARRGRKRAMLAVGHTLLVISYHLLKSDGEAA